MGRLLLSVAFFLALGLATAQTFTPCSDKESALNAYVGYSEKHETISADFTQSKSVPYLVEPLATSGKFYAKGADVFRWEQTEPESYIMILNKEKGLIFEQGKWSTKDLGRNRQFDFIGQLLGVLVSGKIPENGEFETTCAESAEQLKLDMVPGNSRVRKYISRITCLARKSDYLLDEIQMFDAEGNITTIKFTNQVPNAPLGQELFRIAE